MRLVQLCEAKFKKPITMFHGTTSEFLPTILKSGLVPTPKRKSWADDPHVSLRTHSRVSVGGSYWTSNLLTATSSAGRTVQRFGGSSIVVIGSIQTQDAKADEDSITSDLKYQYNVAFRASMGGNPRLVADAFYDNNSFYEKAKENYIKDTHERLKNNDLQPIPTKLLSDTFDALTLRIIAHGIKDAKGDEYWSPLYRIQNKPENPPTVEETEKNLLHMKDLLTRYYRKTTKEQGFSHTLRITEPVTYSGSNRITHIIEIPKGYFDSKKERYIQPPVILLYGDKNLPEKFLDQYKKSIGLFPGLVDKNNKMLLQPAKAFD